MLAIHYHFELSKALLSNPARCIWIGFENIPLFQLYDIRDLPRVRYAIDALSCGGMPYKFQEIAKVLAPDPHIAINHYREELIHMKFCVYNNQKFFVRAYRLRQNGFFKVEITLHSGLLKGRGKTYSLADALSGAGRIFQFIDREATSLNPLGIHLNEYFFPHQLEKEVGAYENELKHLKEVKNGRTKRYLKAELINKLKLFQQCARDIAAQQLASIEKDKAICDSFASLRQLDSDNPNSPKQ